MTELAPVLAYEATAHGWRGLTADGEILEVKGLNGEPAKIPTKGITVANGPALGERSVPQELSPGVIDEYLTHFNRAVRFLRVNDLDLALEEIDRALVLGQTTRARFNRALILLAMGRWVEGFEEWAYCEGREPLMRPTYRAALEAGLKPWNGEPIQDKRLLLTSDHGLGDSLMCLRYVERVRAMGASVLLVMPPELHRIASQFAPVTRTLVEADYFCPMLLLLRMMQETPETVPLEPYIKVDQDLCKAWRRRVDHDERESIGVAWSVGKEFDGDYPRSAPLAAFVQHLPNANLVSVQLQGCAEADLLGVQNFRFSDFADCAALMMTLDHIITIDTAALHLAGAIGHPRVTGLLSHWHSWRWKSPLYRNVQFARQRAPDDWASAFAKIV